MRKKAKYLADIPDAVATSTEALKYDPRYKQEDEQVKVEEQYPPWPLAAEVEPLSPIPPPQVNGVNQFALTRGPLCDVLQLLDTTTTGDHPIRPLSFTISSNPEPARSPSFAGQQPFRRRYRDPADIYANVNQPYSYTPAYHQLTAHVRSRFNREQQLRIAKCMASYRPSFIACTKTLNRDDLVFMEKCFQRTLLEYEKFIASSGTPTVVWRRTGQVAAAGHEFCLLTGWPRDRLEGAFIVEMMDDSSVLEYFDMFAKMAFGDSRGASMTECTLLSPTGRKIKTTSIWTLKRDVFGIPMMIIGNFLPVLP